MIPGKAHDRFHACNAYYLESAGEPEKFRVHNRKHDLLCVIEVPRLTVIERLYLHDDSGCPCQSPANMRIYKAKLAELGLTINGKVAK